MSPVPKTSNVPASACYRSNADYVLGWLRIYLITSESQSLRRLLFAIQARPIPAAMWCSEQQARLIWLLARTVLNSKTILGDKSSYSATTLTLINVGKGQLRFGLHFNIRVMLCDIIVPTATEKIMSYQCNSAKSCDITPNIFVLSG